MSLISAVKPDNINFIPNATTNKICLGWIVKFTCTADAKPAVDTYSLSEDDTIVDTGGRFRSMDKATEQVWPFYVQMRRQQFTGQ